MRSAGRLALAALPGAVLAATALFGWSPAARDLLSYFVPLRGRTAEVLGGSRGPFWNPDVGCGEPYFANPQTALLYPPAWLATVLPPATAVGVEAGLHLALLGVGCALLARRLGTRGWLEVAAGWGVAMTGPVLGAAGVLNNLDALAWIPWVWWAALEARVTLVAGFTAACYLAAEPQLAGLAGVIALSLAPRRRVLAGLVLALGLVAVQALPFSVWVAGGDRGRSEEPQEAMAGVVLPGELTSMAVPGASLPPRIGGRFVAHFTTPLWALVLALLAPFDGRPAIRRLAIWGWVLAVFSVLPWFGWGLKLWNLLTLGLVRYPGRLLFPAMVALVPAAAAVVGTRSVPRRVVVALAAAAALGGLLIGGTPWAVLLGSATAGAVLASFWAAPAALLGVATVVPLTVPALELRRTQPPPVPLCQEAQLSPGRVYVVAPSWAQFSWVEGDLQRRLASLGWGYTGLPDGRRMVRTFAPLEARTLERHLEEADRGPAGRWWLDSLGARRVVAQHPMQGFPLLCREQGLSVFENPRAWPEVTVVCTLPRPGESPQLCGDVLAAQGRSDARRWRVRVGAHGGVLLWLETPDAGWRLQVDGRLGEDLAGPGILHGVTVPAGDHEITARYRPPGLLAGALISVASLCVLGTAAWRRW